MPSVTKLAGVSPGCTLPVTKTTGLGLPERSVSDSALGSEMVTQSTLLPWRERHRSSLLTWPSCGR